MTRVPDNSNGPQMNANEREFSFARHYRPRPAVCPRAIGYADVRFGILPSQSGAGRNPACLYESRIKMDTGFRRDDGKVAA